MGTLASQVKTGVWVQALGRLQGPGASLPGLYAKSNNLVHFWRS